MSAPVDFVRCEGCGNTFNGPRGLRAHQSRPFNAMTCKPRRCDAQTKHGKCNQPVDSRWVCTDPSKHLEEQ